MAITIDGGTNTISGLAVGGLPDGVVDGDMLASGTGGKMLQCLSVTKTDSVTNNNATFTTISGLSQAITPSASSKILVMFNVNINGNNGGSGIQIVRDSTALAIGDVASSRKRVTADRKSVV